MEIQFLGHSCFRIKGKKTILVTDPFGAHIGFKMIPVTADIVTVSHDHKDHNFTAGVKKTTRREPFLITGPGEYEVSEVFIFGLPAFHDSQKGDKRGVNTLYIINMDGLRLVHLGDLGHKLTERQLEEVNGVDVLFIPVGGNYTIGPKLAVEVISQTQPKLVIPMHYSTPEYDTKSIKMGELDEFLKEVGVEVKPIEKLVVSRDKLPEEREIVVLKRKK